MGPGGSIADEPEGLGAGSLMSELKFLAVMFLCLFYILGKFEIITFSHSAVFECLECTWLSFAFIK